MGVSSRARAESETHTVSAESLAFSHSRPESLNFWRSAISKFMSVSMNPLSLPTLRAHDAAVGIDPKPKRFWNTSWLPAFFPVMIRFSISLKGAQGLIERVKFDQKGLDAGGSRCHHPAN